MKIKNEKKHTHTQINWMKLGWLLVIQWQKLLHIYCYLIATTYHEIFERAILNWKPFYKNAKYVGKAWFQ